MSPLRPAETPSAPLRGRRAALLGLALGAMALAGCDSTAATYRAYSETMVRDGMLRTERTPRDAAFSNSDLARNFLRIALFREYRREADALIEERTPIRLSRWEQPVRYQIVGAAATDADFAEFESFSSRLSGLTGLAIEPDLAEPNLTILILGPEERRALVAQLEEAGAANRMPLVLAWASDISYPCVGQVGYQDADSGRITGAMIVIKGELEGVLRRSCIQEETAQTMGLLNDDGEVRPSIFNDDQEFALLTAHDEYLLRILYDRRLKPGMAAAEAEPLLPRIIAELRPADD